MARLLLEQELESLGVASDPIEFNKTLLSIFNRMYPGWPVEHLQNHPSHAVKFVRAVRAELGAKQLPEEFIMRRLVNIRKRGLTK